VPNRTKARGGTEGSRQRDSSRNEIDGIILQRTTYIQRRDPEVRREGNDVTQAAFQSPYAHLAVRYYERMIFARHELKMMFYRGEVRSGARSGAGGDPLGRDNFPELTHRQMFEAGMFLQHRT
jgi:hypothetical protein